MENTEFTIKNKPITFKAALTFTITSVAIALMMVLLIVACRIYEKDKFIWFIEVIPAVALGISVFWLYIYYKEEFSLINGEFRYIKVFKKDLAVKADTLAEVRLRPFGNKTKIEFISKTNKCVVTIFDDGTVMQDGIFLSALEKLEIPVKRNGYENN